MTLNNWEVPNLTYLCSRRDYLAEWFNIKWILGDYDLAQRSCLHIIASEQGAIFELAHRFWILMSGFSSSLLWCWHQVNKPADNDVQLLQKIAEPHLLPFTLNTSTTVHPENIMFASHISINSHLRRWKNPFLTIILNLSNKLHYVRMAFEVLLPAMFSLLCSLHKSHILSRQQVFFCQGHNCGCLVWNSFTSC